MFGSGYKIEVLDDGGEWREIWPVNEQIDTTTTADATAEFARLVETGKERAVQLTWENPS